MKANGNEQSIENGARQKSHLITRTAKEKPGF
jgi:hypothetical protein